MVLTNFECWAHGGGNFEPLGRAAPSRHVDLFNPRAIEHTLGPASTAAVAAVSHISSNGYYGFSYVNAAREVNNTNNNYAISDNSIKTNEVSGIINVDANSTASGVVRCKKRFFMDDDKFLLLNSNIGSVDVNTTGSAKRCRFDHDFDVQYCNDIFSIPSNQIGSQSGLQMDIEDISIEQQPQVDVAMATSLQSSTNSSSNSHIFSQQRDRETQIQLLQYQHYQDDHNRQYHLRARATLDTLPNINIALNTIKLTSRNFTAFDRYLRNIAVSSIDDATMFAAVHGGSVYHFGANLTDNSDENFFEEI